MHLPALVDSIFVFVKLLSGGFPPPGATSVSKPSFLFGCSATGKSLNFDSGKRAVATPTAVERKHLETWCFPKNICHQGFTKA